MEYIDWMWLKLIALAVGAFVFCFWKAFKAEYRPQGQPGRTSEPDQAHQRSE